MNQHLSLNEIEGYIHHTLTDARRETLDKHLLSCGECRARLEQERQLQRDVEFSLRRGLRDVEPSGEMNFRALKPDLRRQRFWSLFRFHTFRTARGLATVATVLLLVWFVGRLVGVDGVLGDGEDAPEPAADAPARAGNSEALSSSPRWMFRTTTSI